MSCLPEIPMSLVFTWQAQEQGIRLNTMSPVVFIGLCQTHDVLPARILYLFCRYVEDTRLCRSQYYISRNIYKPITQGLCLTEFWISLVVTSKTYGCVRPNAISPRIIYMPLTQSSCLSEFLISLCPDFKDTKLWRPEYCISPIIYYYANARHKVRACQNSESPLSRRQWHMVVSAWIVARAWMYSKCLCVYAKGCVGLNFVSCLHCVKNTRLCMPKFCIFRSRQKQNVAFALISYLLS